MIYKYGKFVTFSATIVDNSTGNPIDPDSITFRIVHYDGPTELVAFPTSAMTKIGVGKYVIDVELIEPNFTLDGNYFAYYQGAVTLIPVSAAVITGTAVEDFQINGSNNTFIFSLDGESPITITLTQGSGSHAVVTGTETESFTFHPDYSAKVIGSIPGAFNIIEDVNDELHIAVGTGLVQNIVIPAGSSRTIGEVVNDINSSAEGFIASNNGGFLQLEATLSGASSRLYVGDGSSNTTFGLTPDTEYFGQDNNQNLKISIDSGPEQLFTFSAGILDANQVVTAINSIASGFLASNVSGQIRLTNTTITLGYHSAIDIGNGTANSALGFTSFLTMRGTPGRTAAQIISEINAQSGATIASFSDGKIRLTSSSTGLDSSIEILNGNANSTLGFVGGGFTAGSDQLTENFTEVEEFWITEDLSPPASGINASF